MKRALLIAATLGGCAWFDAGPADRACKVDRECFQAQGELCDQDTFTCTVRLDGGTAAPIDAPRIDATAAGAPR